MFEKEAEEIAKDIYIHHFDDSVIYPNVLKAITVGVQKGAEFGYNKANEWHYPSKGEYPKDNSFVLVWTENGGITTNYGKEYSDGILENGLFEGIHISDVIAWKEIVLPKEIE